MKTVLAALLVLLTFISAQAQQGAVTFGNGPVGTEIRSFNGQLASARVALYASTSTGLGQNEGSLTQLGAVANTIAPGYFNGGTRNIGSPGDTVTLQVRAWTGGYATYELAYFAAMVDPNVFCACSQRWEQPVGGGVSPTQPITGAGRFGGIVFDGSAICPVPEPSSVALGIVGALCIGFCIRRARA
jgi:hypothetical protein